MFNSDIVCLFSYSTDGKPIGFDVVNGLSSYFDVLLNMLFYVFLGWNPVPWKKVGESCTDKNPFLICTTKFAFIFYPVC